MKEKKECKTCLFYNKKKVIQPKGLGICENKESRKFKELLPVYSYCGKHEAKTAELVAATEP